MPVRWTTSFAGSLKSDVELSHLPCVLLTAKNTLQVELQGNGTAGCRCIHWESLFLKHLQNTNIQPACQQNKIKNYFCQLTGGSAWPASYQKQMKRFLESTIIEEHLQEPELDVDRLARYMNMSRTTFYQKINAISRSYTKRHKLTWRSLRKAAALMSRGYNNINEVSDLAGYNSPKGHLVRIFEKQFGMMPSWIYTGTQEGKKRPDTMAVFIFKSYFLPALRL